MQKLIKCPYREEIQKIEFPENVKLLPVQRGYPVPWFVAEIDGVYDFRIVDPEKLVKAFTEQLCWICGQKLGKTFVFVIGPMCLVNRVNSEPPSHEECAEFAAKACPFMIQKQVKYNETNLPEGIVDPVGHVRRQPGAMILYTTNDYEIFNQDQSLLINLSPPLKIKWISHGREATLEEATEALNSGLPILQEEVDLLKSGCRFTNEKNALQALHDRKVEIARKLLPGGLLKKRMLGSAAKRYEKI